MKGNRKIILAILCTVFVFSAASLLRTQDTTYPKPFQISPDITYQHSIMMKPFYNPILKKYVVFFGDPDYKHTVWSRLITPEGKPVGGVKEIFKGQMFWGGVAYNAKENQFLLVISDLSLDVIKGKLLDGKGRDAISGKHGDSAKEVIIKPSTGALSAPMPKPVWIPETNQYGIGWYNFYDGGFYYTALDSNLKRKVPVKKIMSGPVGHYEGEQWEIYASALIALPDKLFWGTAKWIAMGKHRPMGFFTDFKGDMLPDIKGDTGKKIVYPGKAVKGSGEVRAAYNPVSDRLLLTWTDGDALDFMRRGSEKSYFRIMDSNGKFKTKALQVGKTKARYQGNIEVVYNPTDNKFLMVWPEYKRSRLSSLSKDRVGYQKEGKLLARSVDDKGKFLEKKPKILVPYITQTAVYLIFAYFGANLAYNPDDNEYLLSYGLYMPVQKGKLILWGLIYP